MFDSYVLGILWSIGRYTEDAYNYFFLRHKERYFLDVAKRELDVPSKVFQGSSHTGPQYRLKIHHFDMAALERLGWKPRLNDQRTYPSLVEHRDFIRAYIEIHSSVDTITIRKRGRPPYTQPRLRIYGNKYFLTELTEVLFIQIGIGIKKVQDATNVSESSGILYYTSWPELNTLLGYLYPTGTKFYHREYYDEFCEILAVTKKA